MPETPTENQPPTDQNPGPSRKERQKRLLVVGAILLAVVAVVVVVVLLVGGGDEGDTSDNGATGDSGTDITSPYDVYEMPADTDIGEVQQATLVSIAVMNAGGALDYFGLSSDTEPAQALMQAVADANELDADEVPAAVSEAAAATPVEEGPSITFLLPDRGTLAFGLYADEGIVTREGRFWLVENDLSALITAAVSYQEQQ